MRQPAYYLLAYLTALLLVLGALGEPPPLVKLSTGVHLQKINKVHYESSANLLYEVNITAITDDFLNYHNCTGTECIFHMHIKQIVTDTLALLNNTLPSAEDLPTHKNKRALNFIADFSNWCCGYATEGQIDTLTKSDSDLLKIVNSMKNQIARDHEDAIQSKGLTNEYSKEMRAIMNKQITKTKDDMSHIAKMTDYDIVNVEDSVSMLSKLLHRTVISLLWSRVLQDCTERRIPHALVQEQDLKPDLIKLRESLKKHSQRLSVPYTNVHDYYMLYTTTCYFSKNKLTVRIQVPFVSMNNKYELYAIQPIPFHYNGSLCRVSIDVDYIIYKNQNTIIPLTGHFKEKCIPLNNKLCFVSRHPIPEPVQSCLNEALLNHRMMTDLKRACHFTCANIDLSEPFIIPFSPNKFGVLMNSGTITIQCENKTDHIVKIEHDFGLQELTLPCGCQAIINNGSEYLEPDWPCIPTEHSESYVTHLLPASWTISVEQNVLTPHNFFMNASAIVSHEWPSNIPVLNLSSPLPPDYELPEHVHVSSYATYIIAIITFLLIIVISVVVFKVGGTSAALTALMNLQNHRAEGLPLENTASSDFLFETIQLLCLATITIIVLLIYLKLKRSPFLRFLNAKQTWTRGRHRIQFLDETNPAAPVTTLEHTFTNKNPPTPSNQEADQQPLPSSTTSS